MNSPTIEFIQNFSSADTRGRYTKPPIEQWYGETHRNPAFNDKLYHLMGVENPSYNYTLKVLDLGCGGGGFVEDCINDGHLAVGIEGYDYYQIKKPFSWQTIPDNLFLGNIAEPFYVGVNGVPLRFDVITSWEVFEHLFEHEVEDVCQNLVNNLVPNGVVLLQISHSHDNGHFTIRPLQWWLNTFADFDLHYNDEVTKFFGNDVIRPDCLHLSYFMGLIYDK